MTNVVTTWNRVAILVVANFANVLAIFAWLAILFVLLVWVGGPEEVTDIGMLNFLDFQFYIVCLWFL